jgi:hypothetical protein
MSNVLRINCSYKLWIANKTNYQSEPRHQEPKRATTVLNKEQSAEKPLPLITRRRYQETRRVGVRNNLQTSNTPL